MDRREFLFSSLVVGAGRRLPDEVTDITFYYQDADGQVFTYMIRASLSQTVPAAMANGLMIANGSTMLLIPPHRILQVTWELIPL